MPEFACLSSFFLNLVFLRPAPRARQSVNYTSPTPPMQPIFPPSPQTTAKNIRIQTFLSSERQKRGPCGRTGPAPETPRRPFPIHTVAAFRPWRGFGGTRRMGSSAAPVRPQGPDPSRFAITLPPLPPRRQPFLFAHGCQQQFVWFFVEYSRLQSEMRTLLARWRQGRVRSMSSQR